MQFMRIIKGLCKHIEKKLDRGTLIVSAIRDREDADIILPNDPDPIDPITL